MDRTGTSITLIRNVMVRGRLGEPSRRLFKRGARLTVLKDHGKFGVDVEHPLRTDQFLGSPHIRVFEHEIHYASRHDR